MPSSDAISQSEFLKNLKLYDELTFYSICLPADEVWSKLWNLILSFGI